jgi:hypothetical protein
VHRKSILVLVIVFSAGLLMAVSGCGGKKSSATDTGTDTTLTQTTETETSESVTTETEETETTGTEMTGTETTGTEMTGTDTTATETEPTDTTEGGTSGGGFSIASEDCQELANVSSSLSQAFSGGGTADWDAYVTFLNELADKAPDEIADDFRVLADAYVKIAEVMQGVDTSPGAQPTPEQIAALAKLGQELNQAELTQAATNISTWMVQNCGGVGAGG